MKTKKSNDIKYHNHKDKNWKNLKNIQIDIDNHLDKLNELEKEDEVKTTNNK